MSERPIAPVVVTEATCLQALGLNPRRYREIVKTSGIAHRREGHLTLTRARDWDDLLVSGAACEPANDDTPETVDAVLARLGRRRKTV